MKINQLISEEHEAVSVKYSSWDAENHDKPAIDIQIGTRNELQFRLTKLPNEIVFKLPEGMEFDQIFYDKIDYLRPLLGQLKEKNPEAYEKIHHEIFHDGDIKKQKRDLQEEVVSEFAELFDHLVTMLKTRIVTYAHEHYHSSKSLHTAHAKELEAKIKAELAK